MNMLVLLQVLSGSQGNLLEDEFTIGIITEVKQLGNEIAEKQVLTRCLSSMHSCRMLQPQMRPHVVTDLSCS